MKRLVFISFLFSLVFLSSCSKSKFDMTKRPDAFGSILRMTDMEYRARDRFGEIKKSSFIRGSSYEYDQQGRVVIESSYVSDGGIGETHLYEYDKRGHLQKEITSIASKDDIIYTVKESGNSREYLEKDKTIIKETINNQIVSQFVDGTYVGRWVYDQRGRFVLNEDTEGDILEFYYDDKGLCLSRITYQGDSIEWEYRLTEFDECGNWTKAYAYQEGKIVAVRERKIIYWN